MGKKKNKKHKKKKKNSDGDNSKVLSNAGNVGTALAGAVLGEVAQAAVTRMIKKAADSDGANAAQRSFNQAAVAVKDAVKDPHPSLKPVIDAVQNAFQDAEPAIIDALQSFKDTAIDPPKLAREIIDGAEDVISSTVTKAKEAVRDAKTSLKSSKKKG